MSVTYTNNKGKTYHLCYAVTADSKKIYFFSLIEGPVQVEEIPEGYEIKELEDGTVRLAKISLVPKNPSPAGDTRPTEAEAHTTKSRSDAKQQKQKRPLAPGMTRCPVCEKLMRQTRIRRHVEKKHPFHPPAMIIAMTANKPSKPRNFRRSSPPTQGGQIYRPTNKHTLEPEPFECGWCYRPVWRVLQRNGYYRYYDDKELKHKHKCTRPVHWRPDKS